VTDRLERLLMRFARYDEDHQEIWFRGNDGDLKHLVTVRDITAESLIELIKSSALTREQWERREARREAREAKAAKSEYEAMRQEAFRLQREFYERHDELAALRNSGAITDDDYERQTSEIREKLAKEMHRIRYGTG